MRDLSSLLEELAWLNALLLAQLANFRDNLHDPYRGLYVSDADVDALVAAVPLRSTPQPSAQALEDVLARWNQRTRGDARASRLDELVHRAGLSPRERGILLLCLAPEIDLRYQRIYAYLQDDIAKKAPTIDLALCMLCASVEERVELGLALSAQAPLRHRGLINAYQPSHGPAATFLEQQLRLSARASEWLLGAGHGDVASLDTAVARPAEEEPALVYIVGASAQDRLAAARRHAQQAGASLLTIDRAALARRDEDIHAALRDLRCELLLSAALPCWDPLDAICSVPGWREPVLAELADGRHTHLVGNATLPNIAPGRGKRTVLIEAKPPSIAERERVWRAALADVAAPAIRFDELSARYPLDPAAVERVAGLCRSESNGSPVSQTQIERACRICDAPDFGGLAAQVRCADDWNDLVLPAESMDELRAICLHGRFRKLVDERWGFDQKSSGAAGLSVLLSGPSGTGKTMSAGIIARELGVDLYRVDLSRVVSKYIGETEKNLGRVFDVVRGTAVALLFDEADALFAKRSEVKDSHDRFANLETSYLLQRLEQHEGLAFLTTNYRHNIDPAFLRRIGFIVTFSAPTETERSQLWRRVWPPNVPRDDDIDYDFMARSFSLTGGHIKNIAIAAAVRAFAEGRAVHMADIVHATCREYKKLGRSCTAEEFGPYFPGESEEAERDGLGPRPG